MIYIISHISLKNKNQDVEKWMQLLQIAVGEVGIQ